MLVYINVQAVSYMLCIVHESDKYYTLIFFILYMHIISDKKGKKAVLFSEQVIGPLTIKIRSPKYDFTKHP